MADIVNLNRARKARARADKETQAARNRVTFGRTKAEKLQAEAEKSLVDKHVNGHKRTPE